MMSHTATDRVFFSSEEDVEGKEAHIQLLLPIPMPHFSILPSPGAHALTVPLNKYSSSR